MRMMTCLLLLGSAALVSGCSDDPGPDAGGGPAPDQPTYGMPSGNNDSDMDDGSYWPKWKNPCPGPACDPPYGRVRPQWLVDPPPDEIDQRVGEPQGRKGDPQ